ATDISRAALRIAAANVSRYGLQDRITLIQADLLHGLEGSFDIIAANLPYIDPTELAGLQASVRKHEPRLALDGGSEGTAIIVGLITQLPPRLVRPGIALLECDPRQAPTLSAQARDMLPEATVTTVKDLAGWDRLIRIEREAP
ncbi:MAG: protein-(glutamine-N5) methyltransferase, release factor-specific, partial [Anaerolineae bacterium]